MVSPVDVSFPVGLSFGPGVIRQSGTVDRMSDIPGAATYFLGEADTVEIPVTPARRRVISLGGDNGSFLATLTVLGQAPEAEGAYSLGQEQIEQRLVYDDLALGRLSVRGLLLFGCRHHFPDEVEEGLATNNPMAEQRRVAAAHLPALLDSAVVVMGPNISLPQSGLEGDELHTLLPEDAGVQTSGRLVMEGGRGMQVLRRPGDLTRAQRTVGTVTMRPTTMVIGGWGDTLAADTTILCVQTRDDISLGSADPSIARALRAAANERHVGQ